MAVSEAMAAPELKAALPDCQLTVLAGEELNSMVHVKLLGRSGSIPGTATTKPPGEPTRSIRPRGCRLTVATDGDQKALQLCKLGRWADRIHGMPGWRDSAGGSRPADEEIIGDLIISNHRDAGLITGEDSAWRCFSPAATPAGSARRKLVSHETARTIVF